MNKQVVLKCGLDEILPVKEALSNLKISVDDENYDEVSDLLDSAYKAGKPCAIYRECYVDDIDGEIVTIDGVAFCGALIAEKLSGIHRVFPYVSSCGPELSAWAGSLHDSIMSFYANTFNQFAAGAMYRYMLKGITEYSGVEKFAALNPGSLPDWPITQQIPLFELLGGVKDDIGVFLTPSYLMIPIKSISGLLFPSSSEWFNCMRCRRAGCPGRQAEFVE